MRPFLISRSYCGDCGNGIKSIDHRKTQMKANLNIKESTPLIRIGQHAGVVFSKHAISILSDDAVRQIAKCTWYDSGDRRRRAPKTTQLASGSKDRIRPLQHSLIRLVIIDYDVNGVEVLRVDTMPAQNLRS